MKKPKIPRNEKLNLTRQSHPKTHLSRLLLSYKNTYL